MKRTPCRRLQQVGLVLLCFALISAVALAKPAPPSATPFIHDPLVPASVAPGAPAFVLTIHGSGFTAASVVTWNGAARPTTFVSASRLTAAIPTSDIAVATTAWIAVVTPGPGGGTSNLAFLPVTSAGSTVTFARSDYASVRDNLQLVTADFNRDGVLDLATASASDSLVAIFSGKTDGTFLPFQSYSLAGGTRSLAAADFNRDGATDLALGLHETGDLGALLSKGGGYQRRVFREKMPSPNAVATADLDADGILDLVLANDTGKSISIMLGKKTGFGKATDYSIGRTATALAVGDFNEDGRLDVAVSTSDDDMLTILLGNGDGTFQSPSTLSTGNQPAESVIAADLNGDGHLDLVTANTNGHLSVLLGNGDGTFGAALSVAAGGNSITVIAADMNGDAKLDLATANTTSATVSVLLGKGDGTFQNAQQFPAIAGARSLVAGDFNRDGMMDLAVGNEGASTISIFLQTAPPPPSGNIYVVDTDNSRVQVFDANGVYQFQYGHAFDLPTDITLDAFNNSFVKDGNLNCHVDKFDKLGNFLLAFGACATSGIGPGIFDNTGSVAADAAGNVWVTSPDFYYMQKYDSTGHFLQIVCMGNVAVAGCPQATPFTVQPQGIAIDSSGNIYVSNAYPFSNGFNVVKFDSSGNYLSSFGSAGSGNGQFNVPEGLAFDSAGNSFVADAGNNRIQKFDPSGNYVSQFGTVGAGNGQFRAPLAIAFDSSGNIYVTDDANNRVQKFDANGNYLSQFGSTGAGNGQFNTPYGIAISK